MKSSFFFSVLVPLVAQYAAGSVLPDAALISRRQTGNILAAAGGGGGNNASGNVQTSLTLDPAVIAPAFADGKPAEAGEAQSLTSTNNFINFCAGKTITNGQQIKGGSCNPAPMGNIPSTGNMPSAKFVFPKNQGTVAPNTQFTVQMAISGMETGLFTNAEASYFAAPQQLNQQGQIQGHSHIVIEALSAIDQTTPTDPTKFAFFQGLNTAAKNGILTANVTNGLPAGVYKMSSINTAANHQPALVPIAQHGSLDDAIYFTVTGNGQGAGKDAGNNATAPPAGNAGGANGTSTPPAASSSVGGKNAGGQKGNVGSNGQGKNVGAGAPPASSGKAGGQGKSAAPPAGSQANGASSKAGGNGTPKSTGNKRRDDASPTALPSAAQSDIQPFAPTVISSEPIAQNPASGNLNGSLLPPPLTNTKSSSPAPTGKPGSRRRFLADY